MKISNLFTIALIVSAIVSGCNKSSDSKPATPGGGGQGQTDLTQFDENERTTEALSTEEQSTATATLSDFGRLKYVHEKSQKTNEANTKAFISKMILAGSESDKKKPYFESEELAAQILEMANNQEICNPKFSQEKQSESQSSVSFNTSGVQCPLNLDVKFDVNNQMNQSTGAGSAAIQGQMEFSVNEAQLKALKNQDLVSGKLKLSAAINYLFPVAQGQTTVEMSGSDKQEGTFVTKKLKTLEFSSRSTFSVKMDLGPVQSQPSTPQQPKITVKQVSQFEMKTSSKRFVLTVKIDSDKAEQVQCTMNQKSIDLEKCKQLIDQLDVSQADSVSGPVQSGQGESTSFISF